MSSQAIEAKQSIELFIRVHLRSEVEVTIDYGTVLHISLCSGNYNALDSGEVTRDIQVIARVDRNKPSTVDNLTYDRKKIVTDGRVKLSKEALSLFHEIIRHIKQGLWHCNAVSFLFYINSDYVNLPKKGDIVKPTEIEHKTAKRPKRRSVAEAILGEVFL